MKPLINTRVYGYVVPETGTQQFTATYEIAGDQGTLTMAVIIGGQGPAGADMFILSLQNDAIDDPADLPQTLTNTTADIGKTWLFDDIDALGDVIGTSAYVWYGTTWRRLMFGSPGPPGPIPIITPSVDLVPYPGNSYIDVAGNPYFPTMKFNFAVPPGPQGPAPALALCPDVDFDTNPPVPGDVIGFTGNYTTTTLSPPANVNIYTTGGGSLSGTHYWVVTTLTNSGESVASNEVNATIGSGGAAVISWDAVQAAARYNIYRGTSPGGENVRAGQVQGGTAHTFLDTGGSIGAAAPPVNNTANISYPLWVPVSVSQLLPAPYSMPESAFVNYSGISARAPIGSFAIPPQPFPWTPIVWGHFGAFGLELSANPLQIGCEVLLGDATSGPVVGRGFGNSLGEVNVMPHYSTPGNTGKALTPTNDLAVVPANHSNPAEGTLYFNLYNDGDIGLYIFSPTDAQAFVLVMPVTG